MKLIFHFQTITFQILDLLVFIYWLKSILFISWPPVYFKTLKELRTYGDASMAPEAPYLPTLQPLLSL